MSADNVLSPSCPAAGYESQGGPTPGIATEAEDFLRQLRDEGISLDPDRVGSDCVGPDGVDRVDQVRSEIQATGTYRHTVEELRWGARIAWRNTPRCIGKFYWKALAICDMRHLTTAEDVFAALVQQLREAFDGGRVRLLMTVFAPREPGREGIRIWNSQLVRYAGYRQADGSVLGDPETADLTERLTEMGWGRSKPGRFDILPIVIQMPGEPPRLFDLPADVVHEIPLSHPTLGWFADLGLRWHAFPSISDQCLRIGGVDYTAAPFSAWYTAAEIGARNLSDTGRYDMLPQVARGMGLDTSTDRTLWKDRALVELTAAVIHSFEQAGVSVIDHHFATRQFVRHEQREQAAGRDTAAHWELIVPPIGGSATPVWERRYEPTLVCPNFFPQSAPV